MSAADGFIWVRRNYFDHPIFANEPFTEREAFLWMVCEAAWKTRRKRIHNAMITLRRGQLAHSTRFMASAWAWSESRVRRFLGRLKIDAMIDTTADAHATLITICNYEKYQSKTEPSDALVDAPSDAPATHSRRKREPRNQETKEVVAKATTLPASSKKPKATAEHQNWQGSAEEQFYESLSSWEKAGVPRGMLFQIGEFLDRDFPQLIDIAARAAAAKSPRAYLGGVLKLYRIENARPTPADPLLPAWITEARAQGYPVEREGNYWRFAGGLFDDAKEQVGN